MKTLLRIITCLTLALFVSNTTKAQTCAANYVYTLLGNGAVSFTSTSVLTSSTGPVTYSWNYGNGASSTATANSSVLYTYTTNGVYVVGLTIIQSNPACTSSINYSITVSNSTGCALQAAFQDIQSLNGVVTFTNVSTNTTSNVAYTWNFGDNSATSNASSPVHTYSANGLYMVVLTAVNNATCSSAYSVNVNVNTYCNAVASFVSANGPNGLVTFSSTSTGTLPTTSFYWEFGDGGFGNGAILSHVYFNGTYQATLSVNSVSLNPLCISKVASQIIVTTNNCNLGANFSALNTTNGTVSFTSVCTGTSAASSYTWNFGNGVISNLAHSSTNYLSGGYFPVTLTITDGSTCSATYSGNINVSNIPCTANANFIFAPTTTPQFWTVTPSFPYNISNSIWSWGDNSITTNSLYTAHQYSAAGMYNVCLTVSTTCGATASTCATYSVFRSSAAANVINITVVHPPLQNLDASVGLKELQSAAKLSIYPNPSTGLFQVTINGLNTLQSKLSVFSMMGELIYTQTISNTDGSLSANISLPDAELGIYFIKVESGTKTITQKLVIE
jgi:PKD repeat protein